MSELQELLHARGFDPGAVDGDFGPATERAVIAAQHALHPADGVARPVTLSALRAAPRMEVHEYSYGGPPLRKGVDRDPRKLLPGFAARLEILFRRLRADGFDPLLWEGYRDPERARDLEKKGTGIALSMHCLGAAADIVDADLLWSAPEPFWLALCEQAEALGLTSGYHWRRADKPHVQAIPVNEQAMFRAMTPEARAARVA